MCLAVYKPADADPLPEEYFHEADHQNPDGLGFMVATGKKLITRRQLTNVKTFYAAAKPWMESGLPMAIHFRFATHGTKNLANCHPIAVQGRKRGSVGMMHNGILSHLPSEKERSDSTILAQDWLRGLPDFWWRNPVQVQLVEHFIGFGNKLIVMHYSGEAVILNEHEGHTHNGVWYSNRTYKKFKPKRVKTNKGWPPPAEDTVAYAVDSFLVCRDCYFDAEIAKYVNTGPAEPMTIEDIGDQVCDVCNLDIMAPIDPAMVLV